MSTEALAGQPGAAEASGARARRLTELVFRVRELGIVVVLALLIAVTAIIEPRFIEADSLRNLALNASIFAILAVGQTLVIVTRNVDLSVSSVLGLSAFLAGDLLSKHPGMALPVVFLLGIVGALALLIAVTAIIEPRFVDANSLRNLALNAAIFAIVAAGETLVIVTRNVDLSVGSVLGLAAFMAGDLLSSHPGLPIPRSSSPAWGWARPAACSTASSSPSGASRRSWSPSGRSTSSAGWRSCGRTAAR